MNFIDVLVAMRKIHPLSLTPPLWGLSWAGFIHGSHCCECDRTTGMEATGSDGGRQKIKSNRIVHMFFFISRSHGLQTVALKTRLAHSIRRPWGACWMVSVGGERENPLPFSLTASKRGRGWGGGRGGIAASFPSRSPPPRQPFRVLVVAMSS